jgi:hypothetical protein
MRRLALILIALAVVLVVAALLLAGPALRLGLDLAGLEDLRYRELRLGAAESELVGVAYGDITAERVRIAHPPAGLARLRAALVTVEGAVVPVVADADGVRIPALDRPPTDAPAPIPALPFERLEVRDSRIELATPYGTLDLPVEAEALAGERLEVAFRSDGGRLREQPERLALALDGTGSLPLDRPPDADNLTLALQLRADGDGLDLDGLVHELAGWAEVGLAGAAGRWTLEVPSLRLEASAILPDDPPIRGAVRVRGTGDTTPLRLELWPDAEGTAVEGALDLLVLAPGLAASATLAGSGHLPEDGLPPLRTLDLEGSLEALIEDLALPGLAARLDGDLQLALATRDGVVEAETVSRLTLAEVPDALAGLAGLAGAPLTLALGEGGAPLEARLDRDGRLLAAGPAALTARHLAVAGPIELQGDLEALAAWRADRLPPLDLTARLDLEARDLAGIDLAGPVAIRLQDGELAAELSAVTLSLPELDVLPGHRLALTLGTEAPLHATLDRERELLVRGPLRADGIGRIDAIVDLGVRLDEDFRPAEVRPSTAELGLASVALAAFSVGEGTARLQAVGPPEALAFEASARLQEVEIRHGTTVVRGIDADLEAAGGIVDGRLELALPQPWRLALTGATLDAGRIEGRLALLVEADGPLRLDLDAPDALPEGGPLRITPEPADLRYVGEGAPVRLDGRLPTVTVEPLPGLLRLALDGGELHLPDAGIVLAGLDATLEVDALGPVPEQTVPVRLASIRSDATPAAFAPLSLEGTLTPRAGSVDLDLRVRDGSGHLDVALAGSHRLAEGSGQARVTLAPLRLGPGGVTPGGIAPALSGLLLAPSGSIAAEGTVGWGPAGLTSAIDLALRDLSFTSGPARIERINGVVRLDGLVPPSTPPDQRLAIALLDIGLPFTDGLMDFRLRPDGAVDVARLTWRWAGGEVRAQPFRFRSVEEPFTVLLETDDLQLDALLAEIRLDGLQGEGTMAGRLPVRIEGTEAVIEGGELAAIAPGWIRYRPAEVPAGLRAGGAGVELMLRAVENFRYEVLRIRLDGRTDGEMDIGLQLHGANPDLYDGHPVQFNLNVEGELANIIRRSLEGYTLPDVVRERLERFGH